jgi:hypothetical protein
MRSQDILRAFLFVCFFSIGAAVLSGAVLCDELVQYYRNKELLVAQARLIERLKSLNADYEALLDQLREDPNLVERISAVVLGADRQEPNTVYPKVTPDQLEAARQALVDESEQLAGQTVPVWLERSSKPTHRSALFVAGAFLVLVSFIFFGSVGKGGGKPRQSALPKG